MYEFKITKQKIFVTQSQICIIDNEDRNRLQGHYLLYVVHAHAHIRATVQKRALSTRVSDCCHGAKLKSTQITHIFCRKQMYHAFAKN